MPWCDDCAKFWNPNSMPANGECPTCGVKLAAPRDPGTNDGEEHEHEEYRAPWHFKLFVGLAAVYLLWRVVQLVTWVV